MTNPIVQPIKQPQAVKYIITDDIALCVINNCGFKPPHIVALSPAAVKKKAGVRRGTGGDFGVRF